MRKNSDMDKVQENPFESALGQEGVDELGQLPTPALSPVFANGHAGRLRVDKEGKRMSVGEDGGENATSGGMTNGKQHENTTLNSKAPSGSYLNGHSRPVVNSDPASTRTTPLPSRRPSFADDANLSDVQTPRPRQISMRPVEATRRRSSAGLSDREGVLKLSPKQVFELASEPASLPVRTATPILEDAGEGEDEEEDTDGHTEGEERENNVASGSTNGNADKKSRENAARKVGLGLTPVSETGQNNFPSKSPIVDPKLPRPSLSSRALSTPPVIRRRISSQRSQSHIHETDNTPRSGRPVPPPLNLEAGPNLKPSAISERDRDLPSPMPASMPLPPLSMHTFLSLELAAEKPSPLYIYRSATADFPYESSKIKYERLWNFIVLPWHLERILWFGTLACIDAWLHVLTILPLRFLISVGILVKWWAGVLVKEIKDVCSFVYAGLGRVWRRRWGGSGEPASPTSDRPSASRSHSAVSLVNGVAAPPVSEKRNPRIRYRHRRTKSTPSALLPSHKADLLQGLLVICSCAILMRFDASRMYHGIRGQAAIKLYVIYNVLEVCDRLFSALGQDVLECLLSRETLDRNADGRSKVMRPFWMFLLALVYNVIHATTLFYQVITLNVAVNSYSNALLTLLMSNQFVEIKGTVFKKFEKENLFQLTCADVVERFQLWLMLLIIAMRNVVEVGGLGIRSSESLFGSFMGGGGNSTTTATTASSGILPLSFTIFPKWTGQVFSPFLIVLGSEMIVDSLKHAYITKFNTCKPQIYGKFLDVLAKDYYSHAFADQNLTKRLGLPVLPLACLFIRAATQTYSMFIATHMPAPLPSTATSLTTSSASSTSPSTTAVLAHIDQLFRRALGRSAFGSGNPTSPHPWPLLSYFPFLNPSWYKSFSLDDVIALSTMSLVFLGTYLLLLTIKLLLSILLLRWSRNRYVGMKERERVVTDTGGRRVGGWGVVEVQEDKRRWIYEGDEEGLKGLREREERGRRKGEKELQGKSGFGGVRRYDMVAKRIW